MSRFAEVIVIAKDAEHVMEPLTRPDPDREWHQCFTRVDEDSFSGSVGSKSCFNWVIQFYRLNWHGLLDHLQSLPWPCPHSVQVLVRDEEDDCFGLWMLYDGRLNEVPLPRTERREFPGNSITGVLQRTDHPEGDLIPAAALSIQQIESSSTDETWAIVRCHHGEAHVGDHLTSFIGSTEAIDLVLSSIERYGKPTDILDAPHTARVLLTGTANLRQHQQIRSVDRRRVGPNGPAGP